MMGAVRLARACCGQHQVAVRKPFHVAALRQVGVQHRSFSTHQKVKYTCLHLSDHASVCTLLTPVCCAFEHAAPASVCHSLRTLEPSNTALVCAGTHLTRLQRSVHCWAADDEAYDVIVVGAGHAGCEAALAAANMGAQTMLLTLNLDRIAWQPCNPAVGGPAKSQLVHEVDALGGMIGKMADRCYVQKRVLNKSKVPLLLLPSQLTSLPICVSSAWPSMPWPSVHCSQLPLQD